MDIIDAPQSVVVPTGPIQPRVQPVGVLGDMDTPLDDNAVRQALANAESKNLDPMTVTLDDMVKGQSTPPEAPSPDIATPPTATPESLTPMEAPTEVPQKFLKPNGEVDIEKLQTSSRQLDEAIKTKEKVLDKTVDDYLREYQEKERHFRTLPNPERLAASLPPAAPVPPPAPNQMTDQDLEAILMRDFQSNPVKTMAQFVDAALHARFAPIEAEKKDERVRGNLAQLAQRDPRILRADVFEAVNRKLASQPELWNLPNPHKVAYLEVKDEMRLGEFSQTPAQPSKASPAPVLGGGTPPPSAPLATAVPRPDQILGSLDKIDLKNRKQEAMGDEAIRAFLARNNR